MNKVFKKQKIKKFKLNVGESIFFIFLVIFTAYILCRSSFFEVKEISVRGNHFLPAAEIIALAQLKEGTNIFKVNLSQAGEKVKVSPLVKEAHLTRKLPSRIIIEINERYPVALVPVKDGFAEVDVEGVYLRPGKISASGLPVVSVAEFLLVDKPAQNPKPGQPFTDPGLKTALQVIVNLPHELVTTLSEIHVDKQGQVFLYHLSGTECRLGRAVNITRKGIAINRIFNQFKNTSQLEYIDISFSASPVVKYKNGK